MQGMLNAVRGCLKEEVRLDIITSNLANSTVVGFKGDRISFQDMLSRANQSQGGGVGKPGQKGELNLVRIQTDMSQGDIRFTGNELDLAISGKGFFKVMTPEGVKYTRKGNFSLDGERYLVTQQGYRVMGENGLISIVGENTEADIQVDKTGTISADGTEVDQLDVVEISDPSKLVKEGGGLFRADLNAIENPLSLDSSIEQGYLEVSNVNVAEEMVNMIHSLRAFESYQKVIQFIDRLDNKAVNEVGRLR
jgi:flagellar basal-body rod protein FlgF